MHYIFRYIVVVLFFFLLLFHLVYFYFTFYDVKVILLIELL